MSITERVVWRTSSLSSEVPPGTCSSLFRSVGTGTAQRGVGVGGFPGANRAPAPPPPLFCPRGRSRERPGRFLGGGGREAPGVTWVLVRLLVPRPPNPPSPWKGPRAPVVCAVLPGPELLQPVLIWSEPEQRSRVQGGLPEG